MSVINRYNFAKKIYKDYVILILIKRKLYTYKNNKLISFKDINKLKELHINYIIIDNLEIIKKDYVDNRYYEYYLKYNICNILDNIMVKERKVKYE